MVAANGQYSVRCGSRGLRRFAYFEGSPAQEFSATLAVFRDKYPEYSRHGSLKLPRAQRSLQGFLKRVPLHKRPPASYNLITLIAIDLAIRRGPIFVLGLTLMYVCYIRPGELLKVAIEDVAPKVQTSDHVAINLFPGERERERESERETFGPRPTSTINFFLDNPDVAWLSEVVWVLVQELSARKVPTFAMFMSFIYMDLRTKWAESQGHLKLNVRFIFYQVYHTAPSEDHKRKHRFYPEIKERGGWKTDSSVRRYKIEAMLQQVEARESPTIQNAARTAPDRFAKFMLISKERKCLLHMDQHRGKLNHPTYVARIVFGRSMSQGVKRRAIGKARAVPFSQRGRN